MKDSILYINGTPVHRRCIGTYRFHSGWLRINAAEFIETLPNGVSHRILQYGDNGPFEDWSFGNGETSLSSAVAEDPPGRLV